ncbi:MAG: amidohydrolase family protein [Terricaulis sp.]|nr:amidohydrolase family protein [Terricaulis sp.]
MSAHASDSRALRISAPRRPLPPGACDSHSHVFGPFDRFPLAESRTYTPPIATAEMHAAMLERLGLERAVIVQPSAYGVNHASTLDAIARDPARRRGIGVVDASFDDDALAALRGGGIRGMRFTEMRAKGSGQRLVGASGFAELEQLGARLKAHDIHAQIYASLEDFIEAAPRLLALDVPLVLDHMARIGPSDRTLSDRNFQTLLGLLREGRVWVKLTVFRNARQSNCEDVRAFHDALVNANADNLVWGADWPLLNTGDGPPDIGGLLDMLDDWLGDDAIRRKILVDNPARLYGFEAAAG